MTVKELIDMLKRFDDDCIICEYDGLDDNDNALFAEIDYFNEAEKPISNSHYIDLNGVNKYGKIVVIQD